MNEAQEAKLDQVLWATCAQYPPYGRAVSHPDMIDASAANGRRLEDALGRLQALETRLTAIDTKVTAINITGGGKVPTAAEIAAELIKQLRT